MISATEGADVRKYNGVIDCVKQTIQKEGIIRGLYRGQTSLLVREIPGNFMWYGVYEAVCKYYIPEGRTKKDLGIEIHMLGGAAAGKFALVLFYDMKSCDQYEVLVICLLHLNLVCLYLVVFANHKY